MSVRKVATYWNRRGETYDRSWQSIAKKRLSEMETALVRKAIMSVSNNGKKRSVKVLDIGVAIGRICDEIIKHDVSLYGTDVSKTMIEYCQKKYKNNKKVKELKIHDIHNQLPKNWGTFDVVSAFRVLTYTRQLPKELFNIYRSMNAGGILIFTCPNKYSSVIFPKMLHKHRLGYDLGYRELKKIVEDAGFSKYHIGGFSRLLDTFYDRCNTEFSTTILFAIEKFLSLLLGQKLFVRLFYVTCKK